MPAAAAAPTIERGNAIEVREGSKAQLALSDEEYLYGAPQSDRGSAASSSRSAPRSRGPRTAPSSRGPSKVKEKKHREIRDGFDLEPTGGLLGSEAGSTASTPGRKQLALTGGEAGVSNTRPGKPPQHVQEHPSFDDEREEPDAGLFGRWEARDAPCDNMASMSPQAQLDVWRRNPAIPHYHPPGSMSHSLWKTRVQGIQNPSAPKAMPIKPSLRTAHEHVCRDPKAAAAEAAQRAASPPRESFQEKMKRAQSSQLSRSSTKHLSSASSQKR